MVKVDITVRKSMLEFGGVPASIYAEVRFVGFAFQAIKQELEEETKISGTVFELTVRMIDGDDTGTTFDDPNNELTPGFTEEFSDLVEGLLDSTYWSTEWADEEA